MGIEEREALNGFLTQNGCEVISDDGKLKICLSKRIVLPEEGSRVAGYYSLFFIQEEQNVWQLSSSAGEFYPTINDFIIALRNSEEFSKALRDLSNEIKEKRNEK